MPQSLSNVLVHIVFSTQDRQPFLRHRALCEAMHKYLASVWARRGCPVIKVGGVEDHVHMLARQARMIALTEWVKELKRASSLWVKEAPEGACFFQWQAGYGAFSVSQSHSSAVERYIIRQEQHHRRVSFQEEFRKLLDRHQVAYDDRYVWD